MVGACFSFLSNVLTNEMGLNGKKKEKENKE